MITQSSQLGSQVKINSDRIVPGRHRLIYQTGTTRLKKLGSVVERG